MYAFTVCCSSSLHNTFRHGGVGEHSMNDVFALGTQFAAEHSGSYHLGDIVGDPVSTQPITCLGVEDRSTGQT